MPNTEFWGITPFELILKIDAYVEKQKNDQEERLILTYAGATWQRAKTMPSLDSILNKKPVKKQMSNEEMLNKVKQLNAAFGGTTY